MEGAALAGAGQRDRPRKGGKRTKASKAQELFERRRSSGDDEIVGGLEIARTPCDGEDATSAAVGSLALTTL